MTRLRFSAFAASAVMLISLCGCGQDAANGEAGTTAPAAANSASAENSSAETAAADGNSFIITLYPKYAPITCENFEKLVTDGFYDGLTFHRVVDDFMAQGGDPEGTGMGGSDKNIKGEFSNNGVKNDLSHKRGVISMARNGFDMDSASSQFFICYTDCSQWLDGDYAAFGEVTEGMEVVDDFLKVERVVGSDGAQSSPTTPIVMDKVVMIEDDADGNPRVQVTMQDFLPKN